MLHEEIIEKAEEQARAIIKNAQEKEEKEIEETLKRLEALKESALKTFEQEMEQKKREAIAQQRINVKKEIEQEKENIFNEALERAVKVFLKEHYKDYIKRSIESMKEEIKNNNFIFYVNKDDGKLIKEIFESLNIECKIIDTLDDRGFNAVSKDNKIAYDFTLSSYLELKKDKLRAVFYKNQGWL